VFVLLQRTKKAVTSRLKPREAERLETALSETLPEHPNAGQRVISIKPTATLPTVAGSEPKWLDVGSESRRVAKSIRHSRQEPMPIARDSD
jgi:hypothetical protein